MPEGYLSTIWEAYQRTIAPARPPTLVSKVPTRQKKTEVRQTGLTLFCVCRGSHRAIRQRVTLTDAWQHYAICSSVAPWIMAYAQRKLAAA